LELVGWWNSNIDFVVSIFDRKLETRMFQEFATWLESVQELIVGGTVVQPIFDILDPVIRDDVVLDSAEFHAQGLLR
jgi:hypothetical protein